MAEIEITLKARPYQKEVIQFFRSGGLRAFEVWHRRAGKDRVATFIESDRCFKRVGLYWHALPEYAHARRVIWTGFAALAFMAFMAAVVVALPPAAGWPGQAAYEFVFGNSWRIVAASMVAFWAGEFANSFVLARMKLATGGRHLWSRTIGSTVVGQGLDSLIFYPLAFYGLAGWPPEQLWQVVVSQWLVKSAWEALLTPLTYVVVGFLKRHEGVEVFDEGTNFSPFARSA